MSTPTERARSLRRQTIWYRSAIAIAAAGGLAHFVWHATDGVNGRELYTTLFLYTLGPAFLVYAFPAWVRRSGITDRILEFVTPITLTLLVSLWIRLALPRQVVISRALHVAGAITVLPGLAFTVWGVIVTERWRRRRRAEMGVGSRDPRSN